MAKNLNQGPRRRAPSVGKNMPAGKKFDMFNKNKSNKSKKKGNYK